MRPRLGLVAVLTVVGVLAEAEQAMALSCAALEPDTVAKERVREFKEADAAIVGRLLEVRRVPPPGAYDLVRFRVERVYKGKQWLRPGDEVVGYQIAVWGVYQPSGVGRSFVTLLGRIPSQGRWNVPGPCRASFTESDLRLLALAGRYVGRLGSAPRPKPLRLRVNEYAEVGFLVHTPCGRISRASVHGLREDGGLYYRETGRRARYTYRIRLRGKIEGDVAIGTLSLRKRHRDGSFCRVRANWHATLGSL